MENIVEDYAVIVGRFQVDELHAGHLDFITKIVDKHPNTILFLGLSPCKCTIKNPLDFSARMQMIQDAFPEVIVLYITDRYSDKVWSKTLDSQIENIVGPNRTVMLYGSRDSFISSYSGKFPCTDVEPTVFISGTEVRNRISREVRATSEFRKGVIWAVNNQYPKCYPTVDVAIVKKLDSTFQILLGKRNSEPKYRIIGGFVQPGETFEAAAIRETKEETGLDISEVKYIQSFVVDDWRYRGEVDKITTSLFWVEVSSGTPIPNDDIDELRWFPLTYNLEKEIVKEHQPFIEHLLKYQVNI